MALAERFFEDVLRLLDAAERGGDRLERDRGKFLEQALLHLGGKKLDLRHLAHDLLHLALVEGGENDRGLFRSEHDEKAGQFLDFVQAGDRVGLGWSRWRSWDLLVEGDD